MSLQLVGAGTNGHTFQSGYTCTCGTWVPYGTLHTCWTYPTYQWWTNVPAAPRVSKFKGSVKALDALPADAAVGDAYFVEKPGLLVVRATGGWFHFDGD